MFSALYVGLDSNNLNRNMGSLFHGYIMENISPSVSIKIHENSTNPFTSCIFKDKGTNKYVWRITAFNDFAHEEIVLRLLNAVEDGVYLKNKDLYLKPHSIKIEKYEIEDLFRVRSKNNNINIITPASYKSNGNSNIFPDARVLLNGVINKINEHCDEIELDDLSVVDNLLNNVYIKDYNLRSSYFYLERVRINGFMGRIKLSIAKKYNLNELLNFLINASEFTGWGMKTSLGMGGVKIE